MIRHSLLSLALPAAILLGTASPAQAQPAAPRFEPAAWSATRADLEAAAARLDQFAASTAYGERLRASARSQASVVRQRLAEGDFKVGDRIVLRVEGQTMLDDTVTVLANQRITVRGIRQVALAGVLRSELETKLLAELTEVVRSVTISASPLMRVAVLGSVVRPGYLGVPGATRVDQALMLAGGPATTAAVNRMMVVRADTVLLDHEQVAAAIVDGSTLDMLGVRDGDALVVPAQGLPWDRTAVLQLVTIFLFPLLTLFVFNRQ